MSKALQKKIRDVEEQHAEETLINHLEKHDQKRTSQALFLLGGISAVDRVAKNISSQVMTALIEFQKNDIHEQLGFTRFADFLDQSEFSPMTKNDFYRRKELYDAEGSDLYDAFNAMKIPLSTRRLLASGNAGAIEIDGDEIIIGDERADLSDLPTIKALIKNFADDNRQLKETADKNKTYFENLQAKLSKGEQEYDELRRSMDAMQDGSSYERALTNAVGAMIKLAIEAKNLPLVEKERRGRGDIAALWEQMKLVRSELYQDDFAFIEERSHNRSGDAVLSDIAKQVISEDDDFGDEYEQ